MPFKQKQKRSIKVINFKVTKPNVGLYPALATLTAYDNKNEKRGKRKISKVGRGQPKI
ncbi:hypothetical protein [Clostridiisalibacter paucivorans]|uniref:hypothetical protein n=1 Tax=Clostridiisalibacter paucivorans TaxID=408753 RepID=UPI00146FAA45|nr:hypothetical protein [Clostridiisalibacter paucivorans]